MAGCGHVLQGGGVPRRRFIAGFASVGIAAAAAGITGCSGSNNRRSAGVSTAAAPTAVQPTSVASAAAPARSTTPSALDSTKGKPGGSIIIQNQAYHGGLAIVSRANPTAQKLFGYAMSGLLAFNYGRPPSNGLDSVPEPDLAQALPEQADPVTLVFKLRPGIKFHNGADLTSRDVQYSFDSYAKGNKNGPSARATSWFWYDHTETPDPLTAVIKTNGPFADGVLCCAQHTDAFILNQAFEESPDSPNKLMGTGPFLFDNDVAPVSTTFKKNPNFYLKPYPYIDQVTVLGAADVTKPIADFIAHQVHVSYWLNQGPSDQIAKARPDAVKWGYFNGAQAAYMRVDQPPFNDKRVRQSLSMALDRKAIRDAVYAGQGEDDQVFSTSLAPVWGFRKPAQLGAPAKYWTYDPQAAKQLMAAAGVSLPIESQMSHPDANFNGQEFVDVATLMQAQWKQNGLVNIKDVVQTTPQYFDSGGVGNYDGMGLAPSSANAPVLGAGVKSLLWSPPSGVTAPTQNVGHINDPQLNPLLEKQLTQLNLEDRKQTLHQIEDIMAEQQYRVPASTYPLNWFTDPSLRDLVMPKWVFAGSYHFVKYWWFA